MRDSRCREILSAANSGAGGVLLPEEATELYEAGMLDESPTGYVITPLGRKVLADFPKPVQS
jgi:hypothetical protein